MELTSYTHKPTEVTGVVFDGTLQSAKDIQAWVQSGSGMLPVINPVTGGYSLYIPTLQGTSMLNKGDTLLQLDGNQYWPITPEALAASYTESEASNVEPVPAPA